MSDEWDALTDLALRLEIMVTRWEEREPVGTDEEIARDRTLTEWHAADVRGVVNRTVLRDRSTEGE